VSWHKVSASKGRHWHACSTAWKAKGVVQRQAVVEDRRAKRILLCDSARPLIEQIETIATALRHELFVGVNEEDLRVCMRVHGHILANLEKS